MKYIYPLVLALVVFVSCNSEQETKTVKEKAMLAIGTGLDSNGIVTGMTVFSYEDSFAYTLLYKPKFKVPQLLMRLYKVEGNGKRVLFSDNMNVDPDAYMIYNTVPVSGVYDMYGKGDYELSFLLKDSVIAKAPFYLQ